MPLTAEELLAGGSLPHELELRAALLPPDAARADARVVLRPLTVRDLQRIGRAARDDDGLSAALMISQALVEPQLRADEVSQLPAGLARWLVERIDELSG